MKREGWATALWSLGGWTVGLAPPSERQVVLVLALRRRRGTASALRVRAKADLVGHDGESRVALAIPLPGVLAEPPVDQQEVALGPVLGERFPRLAVDLDVHEQCLVTALAVAPEASV